jgi:hypothetical protein
MSERAESSSGGAGSRSAAPSDRERKLSAVAKQVYEGHVAVKDLQRWVCDLVADLKARGAPPELTIVIVKRAVRAEIPKPTLRRLDPDRFDTVVAKAVMWCVEEYYRVK